MNENNEINEELDSTEKMVDKKRRSVTKAGIVAPVVLTLASKSALGVTWDGRCSISGNMSGNASHPDEGTCEGYTPGYWKNHPASWSVTGYVPASCTTGTSGQYGKCKKGGEDGKYIATTGTTFGSAFGIDTCNRSTLEQDNTSMIILIDDVPANWTLHAHAVASLLNAASGINFGNTVADVKAWWHDCTILDEDLKDRYESLNQRSDTGL